MMAKRGTRKAIPWMLHHILPPQRGAGLLRYYPSDCIFRIRVYSILLTFRFSCYVQTSVHVASLLYYTYTFSISRMNFTYVSSLLCIHLIIIMYGPFYVYLVSTRITMIFPCNNLEIFQPPKNIVPFPYSII